MALDDEIAEAILEMLVRTATEWWEPSVPMPSLVFDIQLEVPGAGELDVLRALERLDSEGCLDNPAPFGSPEPVVLRGKGVDRYEELVGRDIIADEECRNVLEVLAERDTSADPAVSRNALLAAVDMDETAVDRTVWYLDDRGYLDATTDSEATPWATATIRQRGREVVDGSRSFE